MKYTREISAQVMDLVSVESMARIADREFLCAMVVANCIVRVSDADGDVDSFAVSVDLSRPLRFETYEAKSYPPMQVEDFCRLLGISHHKLGAMLGTDAVGRDAQHRFIYENRPVS